MDSKYVMIQNKPQPLRFHSNGIFNSFSIKRKILNNDKSPKKNKINNFNNSNDQKSDTIKNDNENSNGNKNSSQKLPPQQTNQEDVHKSIQRHRQSLPVFNVRQRFIFEMKKNETLLLMGETGSGKTTQLPQYLYAAGYSQTGMIAITQPRRVAAITVAKRVAQEMNCKLGELVGFTVRFEDCTSKLTKIRFITDGSLLREALSDRMLKNYSVIMLDEAHERTINTDVLFGIVKEAQRQRKLKPNIYQPLKVIITSATMDIDHFSEYFGVPGMYLEGRTFPVRIMHAKEEQRDYLHACLVTLFEIHRSAPPNHDVLMFLTGQEEIETLAQQIRNIAKVKELNVPALRVFSLYSQLPQNKQLECFLPSTKDSRKVILATNIAETSITIPGIHYVIDCGFVKQRLFDPLTGMDFLKVVRISQAQSWQRCGRAGREANGICYRTYTVMEMDRLETMSKPEILRSNITATVLQLLALGVDCKTFDFLDKPSPTSVENAYKQLLKLGAIKRLDNPELTDLGRKMSLFPLDPRFSKLLLSANDFNCLSEILSLVALMSGENVFVTSINDKREQAALAHAKFISKTGDHLTLLNVFTAFRKTEKIKLWCHDNFLNTRNLMYAQDVRQQLEEICEKHCNLKISSCGQNLDQVRKCLLTGLFNNIAEYQQRENFYLTMSSRQRAKIHPSSALHNLKSQFIVYTEIVSTEKNFLRLCTTIEPDWIEELVPQNLKR